MQYSFNGRFLLRLKSQLNAYTIGFLICCVCASLLSPECGASARLPAITLAGTPSAVTDATTQSNPVPSITSLSPNSALEGSGPLTLTVNGTGFVNSSVVRYGGSPRTTTLVSLTRLTARIEASDLIGKGTVEATVVNPAPGGGVSNVMLFSVTGCGAPSPVLAKLLPNSIAFGRAFVLTAIGAGFPPSSKVRWNGQELETVFGGPTQLAAKVPANLVKTDTEGTAQVTVYNPPPCSDESNALTFLFRAFQGAPSPVINGLKPAAVAVGSAGLTLTVIGAWFDNGATARINGFPRPTTFVISPLSVPRLNVTVLPEDMANTGDLLVTVVNLYLTDKLSNTAVLKVAPKVTSANAASYISSQLAPDSFVAGYGSGLATGIGFANSIPLPTNLLGTTVKVTDSFGNERDAGLFYVSSNQINFHTPPEMFNGPGTVVVAVNNDIKAAGPVNFTRVAPGLFTANAAGQGVAAAVALRVRDGSQTYEEVVRFESGKIAPVPIDLGPDGDVVYALLYGTGIRNTTKPENISVTFNGACGRVSKTLSAALSEGAFAAPGFVGVDQVNVVLPRALLGCGLMNIDLTVGHNTANTVQLAIK